MTPERARRVPESTGSEGTVKVSLAGSLASGPSSVTKRFSFFTDSFSFSEFSSFPDSFSFSEYLSFPEEVLPVIKIHDIVVPTLGGTPRLESALGAAIQRAYRMVDWGGDWDDEGAQAIMQATVKKVERFLRDQQEWLRKRLGESMPLPEILPVRNGSIDILWRSDQYELLVNVPATESTQASFYGDDGLGQVIRGTIGLSEPNIGLLCWLGKMV